MPNNNNNINEFLFFKTPVGGVLAIPEGLSPSDFSYINKSGLKNQSTDYILNVWGSAGGDTSPYNTCITLHKDQDIDACIAKAWEVWTSVIHNGSVRGFDADDNDGNRQTYRACWIAKESGKVLDFSKRYFAGYYPNIDSKSYCFGKPYQIDLPTEDKNKEDGNFETSMKFQISLPLDN